jgi:hypothetical protein
MVLTSEQAHVAFGYALCGRFVPMENLSKCNLQELRKVFFNWSANESRPSFVTRPISGEKCVEGVTLDDEIGRRTMGIQKFRH